MSSGGGPDDDGIGSPCAACVSAPVGETRRSAAGGDKRTVVTIRRLQAGPTWDLCQLRLRSSERRNEKCHALTRLHARECRYRAKTTLGEAPRLSRMQDDRCRVELRTTAVGRRARALRRLRLRVVRSTATGAAGDKSERRQRRGENPVHRSRQRWVICQVRPGPPSDRGGEGSWSPSSSRRRSSSRRTLARRIPCRSPRRPWARKRRAGSRRPGSRRAACHSSRRRRRASRAG
jgi:hypothetical protein